MSSNQEPNDEFELEFEMLDELEQVKATTAHPPGGTMKHTGLTDLNARATEAWAKMVTGAGMEKTQAGVGYGLNKKLKLVSCFPANPLKEKALPVRWSKGKKAVAFHLGAVFELHPDLRPEGKRKVSIVATRDKKGRECLVISLSTAQSNRSTSRSPSEPEASPENQ